MVNLRQHIADANPAQEDSIPEPTVAEATALARTITATLPHAAPKPARTGFRFGPLLPGLAAATIALVAVGGWQLWGAPNRGISVQPSADNTPAATTGTLTEAAVNPDLLVVPRVFSAAERYQGVGNSYRATISGAQITFADLAPAGYHYLATDELLYSTTPHQRADRPEGAGEAMKESLASPYPGHRRTVLYGLTPEAPEFHLLVEDESGETMVTDRPTSLKDPVTYNVGLIMHGEQKAQSVSETACKPLSYWRGLTDQDPKKVNALGVLSQARTCLLTQVFAPKDRAVILQALADVASVQVTSSSFKEHSGVQFSVQNTRLLIDQHNGEVKIWSEGPHRAVVYRHQPHAHTPLDVHKWFDQHRVNQRCELTMAQDRWACSKTTRPAGKTQPKPTWPAPGNR